MLQIEQNIPLSQYSTFGIGGPAESFVKVETAQEMQQVLLHCHKEKIRYFILGKGSNCLFDDRGFKGLIILNKIAFCHMPEPGHFFVGSGYPFSRLGSLTARKKYTGLEFASGIPGTIGGAIFMNAGANGKETCQVLESVDFIAEDGKTTHFHKGELEFAYRSSCFQKMKGAIVSATFSLQHEETARQDQLKILKFRMSTQPYDEKSAGCVFRNLPSQPAGALIDQCSLKGLKVGGAKVSEKHANFIVNAEDATSEDVIRLIALIQEKVANETGVALEHEVRVVPYES